MGMNTGLEPDFGRRDGLIIAIVQDYQTRDVLMQAYMNKETWEETVKTGIAVFWSTSRKKRWCKGETSGNTMIVRQASLDCDRDAVLLSVSVQGDGLACHENVVSCFHNPVEFASNEV